MWQPGPRAPLESRIATSSRVSSTPSGRRIVKRAKPARRKGYYGEYGGRFAPETLMAPLEELEAAFTRWRRDRRFRAELSELLRTYAGRPTPVTYADRLAER